MDELTRRIHALPPELFERIYEFTFTAVPAVHKLTRDYKPPVLLAIDRASRDLFASSYYGEGSTFYLENCRLLVAWLDTLGPEHQHHLYDVKVVYYPQYYNVDEWKSSARQQQHLAECQEAQDRFMEFRFPTVREGRVHVGIEADDGKMMWSNEHPPSQSKLLVSIVRLPATTG